MTFPKDHREKLHSTNPIERLYGQIKRLVGALLLEQHDSEPSSAPATWCWKASAS